MARLDEGQAAPGFTLPSDRGEVVTLSSFLGGRVVLVFYPKAMTSGCTQQVCAYRDSLGVYSSLNVAVLAISPDPVARLASFREKENLTFPLLSDESHEVLEAYGVWVEKSMYGRTYMGVERSTVVVGPDGLLEHLAYGVKPADDSARVLALLG